MEDLSYLHTEYARNKMIEEYNTKYTPTAREQNRKASDPAEAKARGDLKQKGRK